MDKETAEKIEDLLDDSLETLADKKRYSKTMNKIIKDYGKTHNVDPSVLKKAKNFYHYKGTNWLNNNPLEKDKEKKDKDKVAPIFIKLKEVVDVLRTIGDYEFLTPYLDAMKNCGITISIEETPTTLDGSVEEVKELLESASNLQTNVDTLNEELKETKSIESEELNFTPKSSFVSVLSILDKINEGKDVDDKLQNAFTENAMMNNAYIYLSTKNDEHKESDE